MMISEERVMEDCPVQAHLDITQEELALLEAQDADRLKTIGRLAQELFDARKERDALKRAQGRSDE
jgi:hypothetical protein